MRTTILFGLLVLVSHTEANGDLVFTFSPVAGGAQTRVTLSMSGPTTALNDSINISDNTLPFDFVSRNVDAFEFPNPENFIVIGSVSGAHTAWRLLIDDDSPGTDDLQLDLLGGRLSPGETLTLAGSLTDVGDVPFSELFNGGTANNPLGAQFGIVLSNVPEPNSTVFICLLSLCSLGYRRRIRNRLD